MTRRTKEEVCMDVLECLLFNRLTLKYTPLLQKVNTNTSKFKNILSEVIERGWVRKEIKEPNGFIKGYNRYAITNEGIKRYIDYKVDYIQLKVKKMKEEAWGEKK